MLNIGRKSYTKISMLNSHYKVFLLILIGKGRSVAFLLAQIPNRMRASLHKTLTRRVSQTEEKNLYTSAQAEVG